MAKTMSVLFTVSVLLSAALFSSVSLIDTADALKAKDSPQVQKTKSSAKNAAKVCGGMLCKDAKSKPTQTESTQEKIPTEPESESKAPTVDESKTTTEEKTSNAPKDTKAHQWTIKTGTITSVQDPGLGHESHQLAVILPPSGAIYKGVLTYTASEPIQLIALHGPITDEESKGQPIWTPDGITKFALTIVDTQTLSGTWSFAGNAIAVHTKNTKPFTSTYTISYMEKDTSETVTTGTITSVQDPGLGHESHQLAVILPLNEKPYTGTLTYAASEPIQLIALHGPITDEESKGQPIWTPDGITKFALTIVDTQTLSGTWSFAGNAIAVHTKNPEPFTISYTVAASN